MAVTHKVLGQSSPSAATHTQIYDCPDSTTAVVSKLTVCNRSSTPTTFRVTIRPNNAGLADEQHVMYDVAIGGNESLDVGHGITLDADDRVYVYATLATVSFNLFGQENS